MYGIVTCLQADGKKATLYILRELGRRAGAMPDWIAKWRVYFQNGSVALYPQPHSLARLVFPFYPFKISRFQQFRDALPCRFAWMSNPSSELIERTPDFVVLFDDHAQGGQPLFAETDPNTLECRADILTAALWTLARAEESVPGPSDSHARFPASGSIAFRFGVLERPIVDEYALAFRQALLRLIPTWTPTVSPLRLKLSHDIDLVGLPPSLRSTIGHIYPRRVPRAFLRDVQSLLGMGRPAYLHAVLETARISRNGGYDSAFYWKSSARTQWDSGYDPEHPRVRSVIDGLIKQGFEMGVHPAYGTFANAPQLEEEVARLRRVLGSGPVGGRQHFLRWRPSMWSTWEKAGLAYDSSVGFADAMGFRAGTALPYHPWLIEEDRESVLLEIPLIAMDCTPVVYMRLATKDTLDRITKLVRRCEEVGGVFTLLWHNSSVIEPPYASLYPHILSLFPSSAPYNWKADLASWPLPRMVDDSLSQQL